MSKKKGSRTERELLHLFHEFGWAPVRVAGSGSTPLPAPDLLAGKDGRVLAIECKSGKNVKRYLDSKQIEELKEFSKRFKAESWIGLRIDNHEWYFLQIKNLKKSKGNNLFIDLDLAREKGLSFKELINLK